MKHFLVVLKYIKHSNFASIQKNNSYLTYLAFLFFNILEINIINNNE